MPARDAKADSIWESDENYHPDHYLFIHDAAFGQRRVYERTPFVLRFHPEIQPLDF